MTEQEARQYLADLRDQRLRAFALLRSALAEADEAQRPALQRRVDDAAARCIELPWIEIDDGRLVAIDIPTPFAAPPANGEEQKA